MWSLFNSGQLNQAAVQQLAQAVFGSANNVAVVSQGNLGAAPTLRVIVLLLACPQAAVCCPMPGPGEIVHQAAGRWRYRFI